ncbi:retrovirus-related pol polyprotein from transposon TNT 1-94 [Tanacetum coccineum]
MAFMSTVMASRFPSTNNQLRTSSNLRNQATIQDGRVTVQHVQGRQGYRFTGTGTKGNAISFGGNNAAGQARMVKCYNCQGKGHMERQCTQPKRSMNSAWFKEKMLLFQAQESGQVLDEEQLTFLADPRVADVQDTQTTITHNAAFQTDDLDAYDSDYDDISSAKGILMANLSSYDSDVLSKIPHSDNYQNDMTNQSFSNPISEQPVVQTTPVRTEAPSELPKVVKVRTTPDAITKRSWGFEHTKAVFKQEVIPFIKTLWDLFKDFDNGIHSEINEVKTIFNQIEAAVKQCSTDKRYFDIQKKEIFLDNDRLLQHIICQEVINIVMQADSVPVNVLPANNKCLVHDNHEIERLEQENDHLFELLLSQDIVHILLKAELAKKEHMVEKKFFDEVLKRKNVIKKDATTNNAKVIALGMFKLDLEPLSPKVLKNRDAHIDYIKHTQENAYILRELVKHARALRPLDSHLDSACKYAKRIKEVLFYVTPTCPSLTKPSEKLVAITPLNKNKKVRFAEHATSSSSTQKQPSSDTKNNKISRTTSRNQKNKVEDYPRSVKSSLNKKNRVIVPVCNANVKHSILNANSELIYATCNGCLFDAIYDSYVLDFVNDVNARSKYKSFRSSKKKTTWKPTGKIFTTVGYKWIPTSRKFTIEGNRCPLTRTTSTNVVPPKNPLPLKVAKKTPTCRNNPEMRKDVTNKSSSSRSKGVVQIVLWYLDSGCSKHMTRNRSQLINFVHKFLGTVRFGNDQIAKIIGYGDYHMGNVTILGFTMWKG